MINEVEKNEINVRGRFLPFFLTAHDAFYKFCLTTASQRFQTYLFCSSQGQIKIHCSPLVYLAESQPRTGLGFGDLSHKARVFQLLLQQSIAKIIARPTKYCNTVQ